MPQFEKCPVFQCLPREFQHLMHRWARCRNSVLAVPKFDPTLDSGHPIPQTRGRFWPTSMGNTEGSTFIKCSSPPRPHLSISPSTPTNKQARCRAHKHAATGSSRYLLPRQALPIPLHVLKYTIRVVPMSSPTFADFVSRRPRSAKGAWPCRRGLATTTRGVPRGTVPPDQLTF